MSTGSDVTVIGAGVTGLAIAWRAARRGLSVTVFDPDPRRGSSWAAAGMLSPVSEYRSGERALLELGMESLRRWPSFATELIADGGSDVGFRTEGTLNVAYDEDDCRTLAESVRQQHKIGLNVEWLSGRECRELEPYLSPRISGGAFMAGDHQVDNRAAVKVLAAAAIQRGVHFEHQMVKRIALDAGRAIGVEQGNGAMHLSGSIVIAAGAWSAELGGVPAEARPPVRPVRGAILRLKMDSSEPVAIRTVRAIVQGSPVYLVPRQTGELVVGASTEEAGFDGRIRTGAVIDLLRAAVTVLPAVTELELIEAIARLRPGTPDNGPVLGVTPVPGLLLATGHYRNGFLLAPVTADALEAALYGDPVDECAQMFGVERFS